MNAWSSWNEQMPGAISTRWLNRSICLYRRVIYIIETDLTGRGQLVNRFRRSRRADQTTV